jgi:predicted RNA polymerase sigma factor
LTFKSSLTDVISIWALARMRAEDWPAAARGLDFLVGPDGRGGFSAGDAFAWALRGRVYARLGNNAEARKSYQRLFEIWKHADPDIPLLIQAREEFARLAS